MTLLPPASTASSTTAPSVGEAVAPPLPFHRLAHADPRLRWWHPLLVLLLAAACYAVLGLVLVGALMVLDGAAGMSWADRAVATSYHDPVTFGFGFAVIALMAPALLLALRLLGPRPVGLVFSVTGGLRWRWLGTALWRALVVHAIAFTLLLFVVGPLTGAPAVLAPSPDLLPLLVLAVLVVPLQATAEELVFRGWALQAIGTWVRHPLLAVLLPVPLFVVGHPYDVWGQLEVAAFAVAAGWLAWRTGGLEAPIALHVVNNVLLCVLAALGYADIDATQGSPLSLTVSTLTTLVTSAWLLRAWRTAGLSRSRWSSCQG